MNTKYLLAVGAIVTSLTLGACGNLTRKAITLITKINNKKTVM